ncbi:MAG TPA: hybrid sensor histidine kinase/response regulator [Albitalea sp.]
MEANVLTEPAPSAHVPSPARAPAPVFPVSDIVQGTFDFMPATLAGYLAGIGIVVLLYWGEAPAAVTLSWLGLFGVVWLARAWSAHRFKRLPPPTGVQWERWRTWCNAGTLASGALWGLTGWIFYPMGDRIQEIGLLIVIYSFCVAGVPVLATQPRIYLVFATLCFAPLAARIAMEGRAYAFELIGILLIIISLTTVLTRRYRQALERVLELKLHADELLARLSVEKQAADAARREAEVANRAKTQFFTAASHDLRQPLHAMGLFAEALRQKSHDDEVAQLVNSINASVDALEELFSELLDITRIDSGGVAAHPQHFEIGDIFRKLRLHFEPTAFEKGLALRLRGAKHKVFADPLLVERILRNLVSNAIRYTQDGSVLVSCRQRGGRLLLQVWDTGVGISPAEQAHVFEEFYQVPGTTARAAHERKGLGLGLAIVKRLADLMDAPLSLRSEPGRGTVFTLELPIGKALAAPLGSMSKKGPVGLTLDGRTIVVVEDEPAVRSGLEALLRGWGATMLSFDSVAACSAWAETADPAVVKPDLLIVDYRLENGKTGIDAISVLRGRFGETVPAIMVTGSTMTGHDQEAQEKNFHLLIKPVVPNKLRAMIAFKLQERPKRGA